MEELPKGDGLKMCGIIHIKAESVNQIAGGKNNISGKHRGEVCVCVYSSKRMLSLGGVRPDSGALSSSSASQCRAAEVNNAELRGMSGP